MKFCSYDAAVLVLESANASAGSPPVFDRTAVQGDQMPPIQFAHQNQQTPPFQPNNFAPASGERKRGNTFAWIGFGLMLSASAVTLLALIAGEFSEIGVNTYGGATYFSFLSKLIFFLSLTALFLGALALILRLVKPARFGHLILSIAVILVSAGLLGAQILVSVVNYAEDSDRTRFTKQYPYEQSSSNSKVADRTTGSPGLKTAILGKWRDPADGTVVSFFSDDSYVSIGPSPGAIESGTYRLSGVNTLTVYSKTGATLEFSVSVSGDTLSLNGNRLYKVK